jgi:hypothetical protein
MRASSSKGQSNSFGFSTQFRDAFGTQRSSKSFGARHVQLHGINKPHCVGPSLLGIGDKQIPASPKSSPRVDGTRMKSRFVEIDHPQPSVRRDDEVAHVGIAKADARFGQTVPHLRALPTELLDDWRPIGGAIAQVLPECVALDVLVYQVRVTA